MHDDDYTFGDGHTDQELADLDQLYGVDTDDSPQLSELDEQLLEEGWTAAGVRWLHTAAELTAMDDVDLGVFARGLAATTTLIAGHDGTQSVAMYLEPPARAIRLSTWPGETVLDPFMGSGTTLLAARDLGRKAIGFEISERYCEIAANRCAQGLLNFGGTA